MKGIAATLILILLATGHEPQVILAASPVGKDSMDTVHTADTTVAIVPLAVVKPISDTIVTKIKKEPAAIKTGALKPQAMVAYAKSFIGTPYLFGSTDPKKGFDCSGFIVYVFNHFKVKVPRSSVDYTDVGNEINYQTSKPGDLILFTGTDSTIRVVGHMGIIVSNDKNEVHFIHATSGKQHGVTITELSPYYMTRFVRVARVFPDSSWKIVAPKKGKKDSLATKSTHKKGIKSTKKTSTVKSPKKVSHSKVVAKKPTTKKSTSVSSGSKVKKKTTNTRSMVTDGKPKSSSTKKKSASTSTKTSTKTKIKTTSSDQPIKKQ